MHRRVAAGLTAILVVSSARAGATPATSLLAPVALTATTVDSGVELRWQYGRHGTHPDLKNFEVYRSTDRELTFCLRSEVSWEPPHDPTFIDQDAPRGVSVYYVLAVATDGKRTARSNTAAAVILTGGPRVKNC